MSSQWGDAYYKAIKEIVIPLLICTAVLFVGWVIVSFIKSIGFLGIILGALGSGGVLFICIKNKNWIPKKTRQ